MKSGTKRLRFCVLLMSSWTIFNCVADEVKTLLFDISWPVVDPTVTNTAVRPLLKGASHSDSTYLISAIAITFATGNLFALLTILTVSPDSVGPGMTGI